MWGFFIISYYASLINTNLVGVTPFLSIDITPLASAVIFVALLFNSFIGRKAEPGKY